MCTHHKGKKSRNFIYEIYFHPFCRNLMSNTDELEGNVGEDRRFWRFVCVSISRSPHSIYETQNIRLWLNCEVLLNKTKSAYLSISLYKTLTATEIFLWTERERMNKNFHGSIIAKHDELHFLLLSGCASLLSPSLTAPKHWREIWKRHDCQAEAIKSPFHYHRSPPHLPYVCVYIFFSSKTMQ